MQEKIVQAFEMNHEDTKSPVLYNLPIFLYILCFFKLFYTFFNF
jgi:hypothetical protein